MAEDPPARRGELFQLRRFRRRRRRDPDPRPGRGRPPRRRHQCQASGQGGFQVKYTPGDIEYGFYAAQFHDKIPQFYVRPGVNVDPGTVGDYVEVFGEDIRTVGASVSTVLGDVNVAAELSFRDNMPLVASGNTVILPGNTTADGGDNPAFPVGKTLHFNASAIDVLGEASSGTAPPSSANSP